MLALIVRWGRIFLSRNTYRFPRLHVGGVTYGKINEHAPKSFSVNIIEMTDY